MPVHRRIRPFNTRDTYPEQRLVNDLRHAVVARGSMVFVRGQVGQALDTAQNVYIGDAAGQAEQAMRNVAQLLEEAGTRLERVCKITIYLTDPRYREAVYRTVGRWLKGVHPVSTGLVVSELAGEPFVLLDLPQSREYFLGLFLHEGLEPAAAARSPAPASRARCAPSRRDAASTSAPGACPAVMSPEERSLRDPFCASRG